MASYVMWHGASYPEQDLSEDRVRSEVQWVIRSLCSRMLPSEALRKVHSFLQVGSHGVDDGNKDIVLKLVNARLLTYTPNGCAVATLARKGVRAYLARPITSAEIPIRGLTPENVLAEAESVLAKAAAAD